MPAVPKLLQQVLTCLGLDRTGSWGWPEAGQGCVSSVAAPLDPKPEGLGAEGPCVLVGVPRVPRGEPPACLKGRWAGCPASSHVGDPGSQM